MSDVVEEPTKTEFTSHPADSANISLSNVPKGLLMLHIKFLFKSDRQLNLFF